MFKAFRMFQDNGQVAGRLIELTLGDLSSGEVVIEVVYSSVNFKDALAAAGRNRIVRSYPRIGGVDAAGTVVTSNDQRFAAGDEVICTNYGLGITHDGGYARYCRVPGDWIVPLPPGLTLFESMVLGSAGYSAGLGVELLELNGLDPANGPVVVNGATGGVGSLLVDMLSPLGYQVVAVTGKAQEHDFLLRLGASEVVLRQGLDLGTRPLESSRWGAAFDSVGGDQLAWLTRTMRRGGLIASIGNAGGIELHTTVLPFILRGVRLIGVDIDQTPMPLRRQVWSRLAADLKPRHLDELATTIPLERLPEVFDRLLHGQARGRTVVRLA